jgi:UDP-N-acetylmuramoylalanine--D-glutamate ligase
MELSSYQLHHSPLLQTASGEGLDVALFTNLTPDHLAWHGSHDAYRDAKARLFFNPPYPKVSVINADDAIGKQWLHNLEQQQRLAIAVTLDASRHTDLSLPLVTIENETILYMPVDSTGTAHTSPRVLASLTAWALVGEHNRYNLLLAVAGLLALNVLPPLALAAPSTEPSAELRQQLEQALQAFTGVEHRLEPVAHPWGIPCFNDSKATNPEAAITALRATADVPSPTVYLAGGLDKGTPLESWATCVLETAEHVILYGTCRERFANALRQVGYPSEQLQQVDTLHEAYQQASCVIEHWQRQAVLLLSPAAASQDQFTDFEQRGRAFKELVYQTPT